MERKLKPILAEQALRKKGIRLFSPNEFRCVFKVTLRAAQEFIKDHRADLFLKLRNGLYALKTDLPGELEIANRLYQPSYISFEYALAHYRLIPETVYSITSATTGLTREYVVEGKSYEYSRIKKKAYTGYQLLKVGNAKVFMARAEKALVDYLYFVDLKLKPWNDRFRIKKLNAREIIRYARLFDRPSLLKLARAVV